MEVDKNFILLKISQYEKQSSELNIQAMLNQGAADGLKTLLKELEELEKQEPVQIEDLLKNSQKVGEIEEEKIMSRIQVYDATGTLQDLNLGGLMTATDVDAQTNTLTVAQIVGGIVVHTSVTGSGTVTTDTAVNIIAGSNGDGILTNVGDTEICYYINDGDQTLTFAGGTDVTVADTGQTVAANESAILLFRKTAATTVTMYVIGA